MSSKLGKSRGSLRDATDTCQAALDESSRLLKRIHEMLLESNAMLVECNAKLDAIMEHLGVPYEPPADFLKE